MNITESLEDYTLKTDKTHKKGVIKTIGIVGGGTMGQEITILVSKSGFDVKLIDISEERIKEILTLIGEMLDAEISHWGMTLSDKKAILSRIHASYNYADLNDCDLVIECVNTKKPVSNLEIRKEVFLNVEKNVRLDTVICSNASTVLISDLAVVLEHPERAIGVHFLSPVNYTSILEVNKCVITDNDTMFVIRRFAKMIKKEIVNVTASPGNISTRLIIPLINEACELLMEGVGTVEDIDKTLTQGFGMQLGPFALADKIGLDKLLKWMEGLYDEFGDKRYKTSPIIKRMVRAQLFGKRVGEGFYKYNDKGRRINKNGSIINLGRHEL